MGYQERRRNHMRLTEEEEEEEEGQKRGLHKHLKRFEKTSRNGRREKRRQS